MAAASPAGHPFVERDLGLARCYAYDAHGEHCLRPLGDHLTRLTDAGPVPVRACGRCDECRAGAQCRDFPLLAACGHVFEDHSDEIDGRYCGSCDARCSDACYAGDPFAPDFAQTLNENG